MSAPALNSYLEEFFDGLLTELARRPGSPSLRPILHLYDDEAAFVVTLPVPGLTPEDVRTRYADGVLTISGPHLYRTVYLPDAVEADRLGTTLRDGVLTVEVPKASDQPR